MVLLNREVDYESVQEIGEKYTIEREHLRKILGISESTQFRYEKNNPCLKPNSLDRWQRFIKVLELAQNLFVHDSEVKNWLSTPKQSLDGNIPLDLLDTDGGTRRVEEILLQATYGVFA